MRHSTATFECPEDFEDDGSPLIPWQGTGGSFVDESDLHLLGGDLASLAAERPTCGGTCGESARTCSSALSRAPWTHASRRPAGGGAGQRAEHRAFAASRRRTEDGIMCHSVDANVSSGKQRIPGRERIPALTCVAGNCVLRSSG